MTRAPSLRRTNVAWRVSATREASLLVSTTSALVENRSGARMRHMVLETTKAIASSRLRPRSRRLYPCRVTAFSREGRAKRFEHAWRAPLELQECTWSTSVRSTTAAAVAHYGESCATAS